ncbi:retron system putative HNH endonuclease [Flavobacterium pectinovorum]|uniref:retron system putative HNH endonuclease n=1 Tax=Flavobacterium pectinovorum TaxID=29533 RepID=UPI001FABA99E|nr:retron system putative HNH endonuclease [Flavobacterium pectinovorum]MCI9845920.1 TIGR02646 family protein [Flavobacterium pectinovorum]
MKYIIKQAEPESFIVWKNKENDDWKPTYANLDRQERIDLFKSLKEEQGYICCYCERELNEGDCHIEHFRPKDKTKFPKLELVYNNLLCSCQVNTEKGEPLHCGNSKGNWFDENLLISPLDSTCEGKFKYTFDGQILPFNEDDDAAKITIEKLQLNIDKLKDLRKSVIDALFEDEDIGWYLELKDGRFNEFHTTIKYLF